MMKSFFSNFFFTFDKFRIFTIALLSWNIRNKRISEFDLRNPILTKLLQYHPPCVRSSNLVWMLAATAARYFLIGNWRNYGNFKHVQFITLFKPLQPTEMLNWIVRRDTNQVRFGGVKENFIFLWKFIFAMFNFYHFFHFLLIICWLTPHLAYSQSQTHPQ